MKRQIKIDEIKFHENESYSSAVGKGIENYSWQTGNIQPSKCFHPFLAKLLLMFVGQGICRLYCSHITITKSDQRLMQAKTTQTKKPKKTSSRQVEKTSKRHSTAHWGLIPIMIFIMGEYGVCINAQEDVS